MADKKIRDTWDFARWGLDVSITCRGCGHVARTDGRTFREELFPGRPLWIHEAQRRLRCSGCGHSGAKLSPAF